MRTVPIVFFLACLPLLGAASDSAAQNRASTSIDGFNDVAWGSTEQDTRASFGEPVQVDSLDNGIVVLAYREDLLGEPTVTLFAFLGEHGLIKGQQTARLHLDAGDCEGQYRVYRDHVTLAYPLIKPVESYDYPFTEDFCTALRNRRGEWANQWTDPDNGAVVTVIVQRGTDQVKLIYESATFLGLLEPSPEED